MSNPFFDHPILNSPYEYPRQAAAAQTTLVFDEGKRLSTKEQQYDPTPIINEVRGYVNTWRALYPTPISGRSHRKLHGCSNIGVIIVGNFSRVAHG
jgi:hypothetical protein